MARLRHPSKEIEAAIRVAERVGWRVEKRNGHAWGRLYCPYFDRDGCRVSVWSTPRNPERHAKDIRRAIGRCRHSAEPDDDTEIK